MPKQAILRLNSFNCRGLGNKRKRRAIFQWLKQYHQGVTFLQETHSIESLEKTWQNDWKGQIEFSHGCVNSRGVAILFPKNVDVQIDKKCTDSNGRILLLDCTIEDQNIVFINVYAPTKDKENEQIALLNFLHELLQDYIDKNIIIGGDFNVCLDPTIDKKGGIHESMSVYSKNISEFCEDYNFVDIWRILNPEVKKYTWRGNTRNGLVFSRLDFWLTSMHMIYDLNDVDIRPGIKSDHSIITLSFQIKESQKRGRGFWKFNSALLKDMDYIDLIKNKITQCCKIYTDFKNKALLWDVIKCELRMVTVSYCIQSQRTKTNW